MTDPSTTRVYGKIQKAPDLEAHLRVVEVDGIRMLEMRDYILSIGEYGRGYWAPLTGEVLRILAASLHTLKSDEGLS